MSTYSELIDTADHIRSARDKLRELLECSALNAYENDFRAELGRYETQLSELCRGFRDFKRTE